MLDYFINPKQVACNSERKYILWLTDNIDFIFRVFILLPDMQFSTKSWKDTVASVLLILTCNLTTQQTRCCVFMTIILTLKRHTFTGYAYCHLVITLDTAHGLGFLNTKFPAVDLFLLQIYWSPELDSITELVMTAESSSGSSINIYWTTSHRKLKRRKKKNRLSRSKWKFDLSNKIQSKIS